MKRTLWGGAIEGGAIKIYLTMQGKNILREEINKLWYPGMITRFAFEDQAIL